MESIAQLWNKFENWLKTNDPDLLKALNPPATDDAIWEAEKTFGVRFPEDFRDSLRIHDGAPYYVDVFGGMQLLMPLEEIIEDHKSLCETKLPWNEVENVIGPIKPDIWNKKWIPFFRDNDVPYFLDMDPPLNGSLGQVGRSILEDDTVEVVANSFTSFFYSRLQLLHVL